MRKLAGRDRGAWPALLDNEDLRGVLMNQLAQRGDIDGLAFAASLADENYPDWAAWARCAGCGSTG